jgi:putative ABC transport system substrate-binding protein
MKRRDFTVGLGSLALAWSLAIRAETPGRARRIGVLMGFSESDPISRYNLDAFKEGLAALGWKAGEGLRIDVRWASGDPARMSASINELLELKPDVIFSSTTPTTAALKRLNRTIPTVFAAVSDPVGSGFVKTLSHPGGNMTGFSNFDSALGEKWLELLKEFAPSVTRVAVLFKPKTASWRYYLPTIAAAASKLGIAQFAAKVESEAEIARVIEGIAREPGTGLLCIPDVYTLRHRKQVIQLANAKKVPTMYFFPQAVEEGGLIAYSPKLADQFLRAASYVDRILRGVKPRDLPVQAPSKFQLVINRTTAHALGLTIPESILLLADRVIE